MTDARPDILITDIEMPNMTGLELADAVRRVYQGLRVVDPELAAARPRVISP